MVRDGIKKGSEIFELRPGGWVTMGTGSGGRRLEREEVAST